MLLQRVRVCCIYDLTLMAGLEMIGNGGYMLGIYCFRNSYCRSRKASNARSGCQSVLLSVLLLFGKLKPNPKLSVWFRMHRLMLPFLILDRSLLHPV